MVIRKPKIVSITSSLGYLRGERNCNERKKQDKRIANIESIFKRMKLKGRMKEEK